MKKIINNIKYNKYILKENETNILFEEEGKKYLLKNPKERDIYKMQIDGGLIERSRKKCDKGAYFIKKNPYLILIEFKGSHILDAYEQLYETYKWFLNKKIEININNIHFRIICTKVPKVYNNEFYLMKLRKEKISKENIKIKENIYEENIENLH